ncbi:MAG TPA: hypothetical protein DCZ01_07750 [Elusimicrobia bacterium]|nr:hypothetical protein [Elusimicrobiota bacterium]
MKRKSKPLPRFKSEAEEAEFWDTHSATDYPDQIKIVRNVRFVRSKPRRIAPSSPSKRNSQK